MDDRCGCAECSGNRHVAEAEIPFRNQKPAETETPPGASEGRNSFKKSRDCGGGNSTQQSGDWQTWTLYPGIRTRNLRDLKTRDSYRHLTDHRADNRDRCLTAIRTASRGRHQVDRIAGDRNRSVVVFTTGSRSRSQMICRAPGACWSS